MLENYSIQYYYSNVTIEICFTDWSNKIVFEFFNSPGSDCGNFGISALTDYRGNSTVPYTLDLFPGLAFKVQSSKFKYQSARNCIPRYCNTIFGNPERFSQKTLSRFRKLLVLIFTPSLLSDATAHAYSQLVVALTIWDYKVGYPNHNSPVSQTPGPVTIIEPDRLGARSALSS
jgi:hypothetical protein